MYGKTFTLYVFREAGEGLREEGEREEREGGGGEKLPIMEVRMHGVNWKLQADHLPMRECEVVGKTNITESFAMHTLVSKLVYNNIIP